MGSRSRSIRLRIYFLVAIPLIAMVGLLAYVTGTLVNNAVNLDRAPDLINATSVPTAQFVNFLQAERTAAVVYLFQPTAANLAAYNTATADTDSREKAFEAAMTSPATASSETPSEAQAISTVISGLGKLETLRGAVKARAVTPLTALGLYSQGIAAEPKLFLAETNSLTDAAAVSQALGLIATVQAREQLSQEDALLAGMLAGHRMTQADKVAFNQMAATRQTSLQTAQSILNAANWTAYNARQSGSAAAAQTLTSIEQAIAGGASVSQLPTTAVVWPQTAGTLLTDYYNGGLAVASAELAADHQVTSSAWTKVAVISGLALLGLLLTIAMTTLVARGIIRRLRGLERSAQTLAEKQLPDVIARLRRGEDVDVAAEAPPLQVGRDEIGRVGQAFELVRETAVRSAVEEARLRRGLNDVFRSLSRRSQSLLHRQLTLLDQMERRASDPEALDDLFRLDHLTTRMRRHAEGLVILAGAPSGRGWSSPVRMVDVMRGAIAEVEDYARVTVATRSQAALAGSAVTDVIHLLAELIENATTLSPPYTSVRVAGDTVANGFAIEVEDRGLGMNPQRLAELNERLARPPEFNPSDSEQLGLFVVSQLARRHGIRVTLKASPYGGTTAIVLIPRNLVVAEEALRAGLPGEPPAIAVANVVTNGHHAAAADLTGPASTPLSGLAELRGLPGPPPVPAVRISGALRRSQEIGADGLSHGAHSAASFSPPSGDMAPPSSGMAPPAGAGQQTGAGEWAGAAAPRAGDGELGRADELPRRHDPAGRPDGAGAVPFAGVGSRTNGNAADPFDVFMPRRHEPEGGAAAVLGDAVPGDAVRGEAVPGGAGPARGLDATRPDLAAPAALNDLDAPGAGGFPPAAGVSSPQAAPGPAPYVSPFAGEPAPFPGWTARPSGRGDTPDEPAAARRLSGPATPMRPVASGPSGQPSGPPWEPSRETGPLPKLPDTTGHRPPGNEPDAEGDKELPRRIRQASLAPQLRANPPQRRVTMASSGPTPTEIRRTMSALQLGWQEGRAEPMPGSPSGQPPWERPADDGSLATAADSSTTTAQGSAPEGSRPAGSGSSGAAPGGPESTAAGEDKRKGTDGT
jgi:signal transduction histidine kinase